MAGESPSGFATGYDQLVSPLNRVDVLSSLSTLSA